MQKHIKHTDHNTGKTKLIKIGTRDSYKTVARRAAQARQTARLVQMFNK